MTLGFDYIIPSDNWEQQPYICYKLYFLIISYQAITGNNNFFVGHFATCCIISYQAITGNNNLYVYFPSVCIIISYQAITGNNND